MNRCVAGFVLAGVVAAASLLRCETSQASREPDTAVVDDTPQDRISRDASTSDAEAAPADAWAWVTQPCDASLVELPLSGTTMTMVINNWDRYVVYDDRRDPASDRKQDIYLYDLHTCTEYQLTDAPGSQVGPTLWGDEVVWFNDHGASHPAAFSVDTFDLSEAALGTLNGISAVGVPAYNGRYLVTYSSEGERSASVLHPVLVDLWTLDEYVLAEAEQGAEHFSISETHLAWVMSCETCGGVADVFYMDLETKDIVHIESTVPGNQLHPSLWGDHLLWQDDRETGAWTLYEYRFSTGRAQKLVDDPHPRGLPHVRGHLAVWFTCEYSQDCQNIGGDIVLFDLASRASRRVTTSSGHYRPLYAQNDWLVFLRKMSGDFHYQAYGVDLHAANLVDESGHVRPD